MQFSAVLILLAAAFVAAEETTTLTSTMTKTMTITKCNPSFTDCPFSTPEATPEPEETDEVEPTVDTSSYYPMSNSTSIVGPTGTGGTGSPTLVTSTETAFANPTGGVDGDSDQVPINGAGSLVSQSGMLFGVLAAGVALF